MAETITKGPDVENRRPIPSDKQTKSEQLRAALLELIENDLKPHDRVPTERSLADQFDVSRLTARSVVERLEHEGRVYRIQGSGTYVAPAHVQKSLELSSFSEDMRNRGMIPGAVLLRAERSYAGTLVSRMLSVSPQTEVDFIERVRTADGSPMCIEKCYFIDEFIPGFLEADLTGSLYELLAGHYGITIDRVTQTIHSVVLESDDAKRLDAPVFSPAFLVTRTSYDTRGRAIEYAESVYRGDRYAYELDLSRRNPGQPAS